jgi:hypothetical protein
LRSELVASPRDYDSIIIMAAELEKGGWLNHITPSTKAYTRRQRIAMRVAVVRRADALREGGEVVA